MDAVVYLLSELCTSFVHKPENRFLQFNGVTVWGSGQCNQSINQSIAFCYSGLSSKTIARSTAIIHEGQLKIREMSLETDVFSMMMMMMMMMMNDEW